MTKLWAALEKLRVSTLCCGGGCRRYFDTNQAVIALVREMLEEAAREGYGEGYYNGRIPDAPDE